MKQEMPEWLDDLSVLEKPKYLDKDENLRDAYYLGFEMCYSILSKPENLIKLQKIKKLVDACQPESKKIMGTILGDDFSVYSLNKEKIKEALQPFLIKE